MLSEARANTEAEISIINLRSNKVDTKFHRLADIVNNMKARLEFDKLLEKVTI